MNTVHVSMIVTGIVGIVTLGWVDIFRRFVRSASGTLDGSTPVDPNWTPGNPWSANNRVDPNWTPGNPWSVNGR